MCQKLDKIIIQFSLQHLNNQYFPACQRRKYVGEINNLNRFIKLIL